MTSAGPDFTLRASLQKRRLILHALPLLLIGLFIAGSSAWAQGEVGFGLEFVRGKMSTRFPGSRAIHSETSLSFGIERFNSMKRSWQKEESDERK